MSNWLDLKKIAESGQCFCWRLIGDGTYEVSSLGRKLAARQLSPDCIEASCDADEWRDIWSGYFDMGSDYAAYEASIDPDDEYLLAAANAAHGLRLLRQDFWETLVSFIVSQNNNIPRITGILNRLCVMCDGFPNPTQLAALSVDELTKCGVGYRAPYLIAAAIKYIDDKPETFLSQYSYNEAKAYLMGYHGIGPKVADCVCLYGLGHREAFPRDVWVKRIEREHYDGCFPEFKYPECAGVLQLFMFWYERRR